MEQHVKDYINRMSVVDQILDLDPNDQVFAYDCNEVLELLFDPESNNFVFIVGESCLRKEDMLSLVCQELYQSGIAKNSMLFLDYDLPILHGEEISGMIEEMYHSRQEEKLYLIVNEIQMIDDWFSFVESLRANYPRIQLICSSTVAPSIYETLYNKEPDYCKVVVLSRKNASNTKNSSQGFGTFREFKYNIKDDVVEIKGLTKEGKTMTEHKVPSHIDGFPVKVIASGAFHDRREMESIIIPEGVERIGDYAFTRCSGLRKIVLPRSLTYLGDHSFLGADKLEEIVGGNNVTHIGNSAFYGTKWFDRQSTDFVILGKTLYRYIGASKNPVVPDSIRNISSYCFAYCDIESVTLPPKGKIEEGAFYSCGALRLVQGTLQDKIPAFCFFGCGMLESINCRPREIGKFGLYGCRRLRELNVNNSSLDASSVAYCSDLKSVIGRVIRVGKGAFFGCTQLQEVDLCHCKTCGCFSFYKSGLGSIDLPGSEDLGDYAFGQCTNIIEFSICKSSRVGEGTLMGCENVIKMSISGRYKISYYFKCIPEHLEELAIHGDIVDNFNRNSASLKRLYLSNVKVFGRWSFYSNTGLKKIVFSNVSNIGEWSFAYCGNLVEVDLPGSISHIGMNAFRYCHKLSCITLRHNSLVTFGVNALNSSSQKVLLVPESLKERYLKYSLWSKYVDCIEPIPSSNRKHSV